MAYVLQLSNYQDWPSDFDGGTYATYQLAPNLVRRGWRPRPRRLTPDQKPSRRGCAGLSEALQLLAGPDAAGGVGWSRRLAARRQRRQDGARLRLLGTSAAVEVVVEAARGRRRSR